MGRFRIVAITVIFLGLYVAPTIAIGTTSGITHQDRTDPQLIKRVEPEYPPEEREKRTEGRVVVEAEIYANGSIEVLRVVRSLGEVLDNNAINAIMQWEFEPATLDGVAVDRRVRIEVDFSLGERDARP
jgi:TonB family protein